LDEVILPLKRINNKTLRQTVYENIRKSIIAAELLPGEVISLRSMAASLGVSQMPVREALLQLEREKVVVIESNKSMRVNKLKPNELDEILWIRLTLEKMAAEKACDLRPDSCLPRMEALIADMWDSTDKPKDYFRKNVKLHFSIYQLARSPNLLQIIDGLWARIGPYLNIQMLGRAHIQKVAMSCHESMVQALAERDKAKMCKAIEEDLGRTADRIRPLLDKPLGYLND
jgi:DNA-binding GntR family transcriptional regulator